MSAQATAADRSSDIRPLSDVELDQVTGGFIPLLACALYGAGFGFLGFSLFAVGEAIGEALAE